MRFSSFSDEWTTTILKDSASFYKGTGISKEELSEEGHPCILYGELYTTYKTEKIEDVKSKTSLPAEKLVKSKANDVIIPASGETPIDIATACCIMNDDILLGGDLNIIRIKNHNGVFLSCQLNGKRKLDIAKIAQGASIVHLHNDDLKKLKCYFPKTICEEEKIVAFLSKIDERIETQSKIIEDLELVKKGIYNHIFTQLNSVEKVLLEELLIDFNKRTLTDKQYPILSSTLSGIYLQEDYFNKQAASASTEGYKIVPYGFATYRSMSDTGEFRFNLQTIVENGIVSPAYPVFTCIENYRLDFILFCLNYYDDIKKQLFSMKQGGTRLALHFNSLCKLYIPQIDKEKQSKIMAIVNSYDAKIVVEKQILEKLKEQKKFLLSNMFI